MSLQGVAKFIVIGFFVLCAIDKPLYGQEVPNEVFPDSTYVMTQLFAFSSDSMEGRSTMQVNGIKKARKFIIDELVTIGVPAYVPDYTQNFDIPLKSKDTIQGVNILAYVEGYSSDEIIVISAHYDHVGMKDSLNIFNGADDNASGTIALLEMAKYFNANQPEHDIIFAFFDAEEMGLLGAKHFVSSSVIDSSLLKLNVNMDMVARGDRNELFAVGTYFYPQLKIYITEAAKNKHIKMIYGADKPKDKPNWVQASDHGAFHKVGVPFVYFGVDDHKDYHKITDTAEKVNPVFYLEAIELIRDAVLIFDTSLEYITLNKK